MTGKSKINQITAKKIITTLNMNPKSSAAKALMKVARDHEAARADARKTNVVTKAVTQEIKAKVKKKIQKVKAEADDKVTSTQIKTKKKIQRVKAEAEPIRDKLIDLAATKVKLEKENRSLQRQIARQKKTSEPSKALSVAEPKVDRGSSRADPAELKPWRRDALRLAAPVKTLRQPHELNISHKADGSAYLTPTELAWLERNYPEQKTNLVDTILSYFSKNRAKKLEKKKKTQRQRELILKYGIDPSLIKESNDMSDWFVHNYIKSKEHEQVPGRLSRLEGFNKMDHGGYQSKAVYNTSQGKVHYSVGLSPNGKVTHHQKLDEAKRQRIQRKRVNDNGLVVAIPQRRDGPPTKKQRIIAKANGIYESALDNNTETKKPDPFKKKLDSLNADKKRVEAQRALERKREASNKAAEVIQKARDPKSQVNQGNKPT